MAKTLCTALTAVAGTVVASAAFAQPVNDHCADAIPLADHSVTLWNPTGATRDVTLPCDQFPEGAFDVWYSYTPTAGQNVTISTCGGPTQYVSIGVFQGCGGPLVACDSWSCNGETQSEVSFAATGGQTYYICLVGYEGAEGDGYVAINTPVVVPPPANDTCETAQVITAAGSYPFDSTGAHTDGPSGPCNVNGRPDWNDVYFRYTPSADGWVRFDTLDQPQQLNTSIQVYDGCGGQLLACNDDVNWSGSVFNYQNASITCPVHVAAGSSYVVRVATVGAHAGGGRGILRVSNVAGPLVYAAPANAVAEPGPECDGDYTSDINYGCNPRVGPTYFRAIDLALCDTRKGHIDERSTPIEDGTLIHDFDGYHFTLTSAQTVHVRGQAQFVGVVTFRSLPCNAGVSYSGQIGQNTNPECGAAEFDLSWDLPAGEYMVGFGVAPVNRPVCGVNDEYWFTVTGSAQCPGPCVADLGGVGGVAGADGALNNNDFIAFINYFFNGDAHADVGMVGGLAGHDGLYDNNDFIAFINAFFAGCP
ncbi:MAG: GC-type dockerin domain-anchored protein [Phycisphaerales bacterium]